MNFYTGIIGMQEVGRFSIDNDFGKRSELIDGLPIDDKISKLEDNANTTQIS